MKKSLPLFRDLTDKIRRAEGVGAKRGALETGLLLHREAVLPLFRCADPRNRYGIAGKEAREYRAKAVASTRYTLRGLLCRFREEDLPKRKRGKLWENFRKSLPKSQRKIAVRVLNRKLKLGLPWEVIRKVISDKSLELPKFF